MEFVINAMALIWTQSYQSKHNMVVDNVASQAIKKWKQDGLIPLMSATPSWVYGQFRSFYTRNIKWETVSNPHETTYVNPNDVEYLLLESEETDWSRRESVSDEVSFLYNPKKAGFRRKKNIGRVVRGDWDLQREPFKENSVYQAIVAHFEEGESWENTEFVQNCLKRIELGYESYGCSSAEEFQEKRLSYIEELYKSISETGYLTQEEAETDERNKDLFHEVSINIGRDGELIFNNRSGHHRLSIAKVLNIESIPVVVIVRHKKWQDIRNEVRKANSYDELSKKAKDNIHHPDLCELVNKDWF